MLLSNYVLRPFQVADVCSTPHLIVKIKNVSTLRPIFPARLLITLAPSPPSPPLPHPLHLLTSPTYQYVYGGESGIEKEPPYIQAMVAVSYTALPVFFIPQVFHVS